MHDHRAENTGKGQDRIYRSMTGGAGLISFRAVSKETDLMIQADSLLDKTALELVLKYRSHIEGFIELHPEFATTLTPFYFKGPAPDIVKQMIDAGQKAGVGPMAAVAGAMAGKVGNGLLEQSRQVIVENGGDLFLKSDKPAIVGIYAGKSKLNMKLGLTIDSSKHPTAVCTSSGRIGHSLSLGNANAVCVVSDSCALADAAATAIGNHVKKETDIGNAIESGRHIHGVKGIVVIQGKKIGAWGKVELIPLKGKKG